MITQCCVEALYRLGKENQFIVNIAKKCERRKCNHRSAIDPADCIKEVVGTSGKPGALPAANTLAGPTNKHRYVLALSSPSLTRTLSTVPGLPIVHFNARGVLVLSPPSTATIRVKNTAEEGRRIEGAKILDGVVDGENVVGADSTGPRGAAAERTRKVKARGPNPLSMKKKKTAADSEGSGSAQKRRREDNHDVDDDDSAGESEDGGDAAAGRRKKKRRRGRGKGVVAAAIADMRTDDAAGTSEVGGETQE